MKKTSKVNKGLIASTALGASASIGAIASLAILKKENDKLKKMIADLQEEVGSYRKEKLNEPQTNFSWFGKQKQPLDAKILKEENLKLIKQIGILEDKIKNLENNLSVVTNNFNLCEKHRQELFTYAEYARKKLEPIKN